MIKNQHKCTLSKIKRVSPILRMYNLLQLFKLNCNTGKTRKISHTLNCASFVMSSLKKASLTARVPTSDELCKSTCSIDTSLISDGGKRFLNCLERDWTQAETRELHLSLEVVGRERLKLIFLDWYCPNSKLDAEMFTEVPAIWRLLWWSIWRNLKHQNGCVQAQFYKNYRGPGRDSEGVCLGDQEVNSS